MKYDTKALNRRSRNGLKGLMTQRDKREKEQLNRKLELILKHYNNENLYKTAKISQSNLLQKMKKTRRRTQCSLKLSKHNNNQFYSRDFPKLYTNRTTSTEENIYSHSPTNIINIINNVKKERNINSKEKKIDLKMNINRYDIKCYLNSTNKLEDMFSNIQKKQKNDDSLIRSRNKKHTNNTIHSEDNTILRQKEVGVYKKCISLGKRRTINLFITSDEDGEGLVYGNINNKKNVTHNKLKAKLLKFFTLTQKHKKEYFDDTLDLDDEDPYISRGSFNNKNTHENVIKLKNMKTNEAISEAAIKPPLTQIESKIKTKHYNQLNNYIDNAKTQTVILQNDKQRTNVDFSVDKVSLSKNKVIQIDRKKMTHYSSKSIMTIVNNQTIPKVISNTAKINKHNAQILNKKKPKDQNEILIIKDNKPSKEDSPFQKNKTKRVIPNKSIPIEDANNNNLQNKKEKKQIIPPLICYKSQQAQSKIHSVSDNALSIIITKEKDLQELSTLCISRNKESKLEDGLLTERKDDQRTQTSMSNFLGNSIQRKRTSQLKLRTKKQISIKKCILDPKIATNSFSSFIPKEPAMTLNKKEEEEIKEDQPLSLQKKVFKRQKTRMMDYNQHGNVTDNEERFKSSKCSKRASFTKETQSNKDKRRSTQFIPTFESRQINIIHIDNKNNFLSSKKLYPNINHYMNTATIIDSSNESNDDYNDDNDCKSYSSFCQIESERLALKIFHKVYLAEANDNKLNAVGSYDENDFIQENIQSKKLYQFTIKAISKKHISIEKNADIHKQNILDKAYKKIQIFVVIQKTLNFQKDYLAEISSNIDKEKEQNNVLLMSNELTSSTPSLFIINTICSTGIPSEIKTKLLNSYFDLQDSITEKFLTKRNSMKTLTVSKRKQTQKGIYEKNFTSLKMMHCLAITNPENIVFIHHFITRDIHGTMKSHDESALGYYDNNNKNQSNNNEIYFKSNSLHSIDKNNKRNHKGKSRFTIQGGTNNDNTIKEEHAILNQYTPNNITFNPDKSPLKNTTARQSFNINNNNNILHKNSLMLNITQCLNTKKRKESMSMIKSIINNIPKTKLIKGQNNKKKRLLKKHHTLFSSDNKEITLLQTNEIKNRLIQLIENDKYALIFYYINDCNLMKLNDIIIKDLLNIDLNYQDPAGNTFLIHAVQSNAYDICKYLLAKGCNPNITNAHNNSPLHFALSMKNFKFVDLLISCGANESLVNIYGLNPWQTQGKPL